MTDAKAAASVPARLAVLTMWVALAACGGGGTPDTPAPPPTSGTPPPPPPPPPPPATPLPDRIAIVAGARAEPDLALAFNSDLAATAGLSFAWTFGDGEQASAPTPTHRYLRPGRYTVTLTVANAAGTQRQASHHVDVARCAAPAQGAWCRQSPGGDQPQILDLRWADAQTAYAVGELGAVLKTVDAGEHWAAVDTPLGQTLVQLAVADARQLWALAADHTTIWRSRDGGASWAQASGKRPVPRVSELFTSRSGLLVAHNEASPTRSSAVSADGGETWRAVPRVVQLEDDGALWVCQDSSCLWRSGDAGASFVEEIGPLQDAQPYSIGWGFGADGHAWHFQGNQAVWRPGAGEAWAPWLLPDRNVDTLYADRRGQWARTSSYDAQLGRWAIRDLWHRPLSTQAWARAGLPAGVSLRDMRLGEPYSGLLGAPLWVDGQSLALPGWITTDAGLTWTSLQPLQDAAWGDDTRLLRMERVAAGGLMAALARPAGSDAAEHTARQHLRSVDEGRTWSPLPGGDLPRYTVTGLVMLDAQRGVASTDQADLWLHTDDGGLNWHQATGLPLPGLMKALHFPTPARGLAVVGGRLVESLDAGHSWRLAAPALQAVGQALWARFLDPNIGHVSVEVPGECYLPLTFIIMGMTPERGRCVRLYRTQDGGASWLPITEAWAERIGAEPSGFVFMDAQHGVRARPRLMSTHDGGATWQNSPDTAPNLAEDDAVRLVRQDARTVWAIGSMLVLHSADAGVSWAWVYPPISEQRPFPLQGYWARRVRDVQFIGDGIGWLVGDDGLLLVAQGDGNGWRSQSLGLNLGLRTAAVLPGQGVWLAGERGSIFRRRLP